MNVLNEQLQDIRNKKKLYKKSCEVALKENNMQELYTLSKKIMILDKEEDSILKELNER